MVQWWNWDRLSIAEARRIMRENALLGWRWYIYLLHDESLARDKSVIYVGKGTNERFVQHRWRWGNYLVSFYGFALFEWDALDGENEAIALGRREGWPLRNKMLGGAPGYYHTSEHSLKATTQSNTPANRERKRQKALAQWAARRDEMVEAIRAACQTDEFRVKARESHLRWLQEQANAK